MLPGAGTAGGPAHSQGEQGADTVARSQRRWVQLEVRESPGAEMWYFVRHRGGIFRVPSDVSLAEAVLGVKEGWSGVTKGRRSVSYIRVPTETFNQMQAESLAFRAARSVEAMPKERRANG